MTQPATTPGENVQRGAVFTLLSIPLSIVIFAVVGGVFGLITWIAAIAIPYVAGWLYVRGARGALTKAGWAAYAGITSVAVILGMAVGVVAGFYNSFIKVGGDGGIFGGAFATTVRNQLTTNLSDNLFPVILGLGVGAVGIFSVMRGRRSVGMGPGNTAQSNMPGSMPGSLPGSPGGNPEPNPPSSGVVLNGKPIDPDER